jgi:hypothetical protein
MEKKASDGLAGNKRKDPNMGMNARQAQEDVQGE